METYTNITDLTSTKQSAQGPLKAARADIAQTKDRRIDLKVDSAGAVNVSSARSDCFVTIEADRNRDGATSYLSKRPTNSVGSYGSIRGVIFPNTFTAVYLFDAATSRASRLTGSVCVFRDSVFNRP